MQVRASMEGETVKGTAIWELKKEERWRKVIARGKQFFGWLFLILFLNAVGWMLGALLVSIR